MTIYVKQRMPYVLTNSKKQDLTSFKKLPRISLSFHLKNGFLSYKNNICFFVIIKMVKSGFGREKMVFFVCFCHMRGQCLN